MNYQPEKSLPQKKGKPSKRKHQEVHSFAAAISILATVFVGIFLIEGVVRCADIAGYSRFFEEESLPVAQAFQSSQGQSLGSAYEPVLPKRFEEEIFSLAPYRDVQVSDTGDVVGCLAQGDATACFSTCTEKLTSKGWVPVESGQAQAASFFKEGGHYTRLYLSCTAVSDEVA
ncbi:MAG: hypothetical protein RR204_06870, partial [Raoultibacter sp.]